MPISLTNNNFSILHPGYVSGRYYQGVENVHAVTSSSPSLGIAASTIYYVPFFIHKSISISRLAISCSNAISNANIRIGIYSNNDGLPQNLLIDVGELSLSSVGVKEGVISLTFLNPGWYWFAAVSGVLGSLHCANPFFGNNYLLGQSIPVGAASVTLNAAYSYGSLPALAPNNLSIHNGLPFPLFWYKVV